MPRWSKPLFASIASVLSCVCVCCMFVYVCATTEGLGKSRTRTGTLGDTWNKREPGEADHQHSSQGSSSVAQGYWRDCVRLKM